MRTSVNSSGKIDIYCQINRAFGKDFVFDSEDEDGVVTDDDVTGSTWQLIIKRYIGDYTNLLSFTLGSGLSFPVYTTNTVRLTGTSTNAQQEAGEYYWELYNITEQKTKVSGRWFFTYDPQE